MHKEIPPRRVFSVFAREIVSENREADLGVLGLFNQDKMDLIVFTSYPFSLGKKDRAQPRTRRTSGISPAAPMPMSSKTLQA